MGVAGQTVDIGMDGDKLLEVGFKKKSFGVCHYFISVRFLVGIIKAPTYFLLPHHARRLSAETSQESAPGT